MIVCLIVPCLLWGQEEEAASPEDLTFELIDAIFEEEPDIRDVRRLLDEGADASAITDAELPIVSYAAMKGHDEVVAALVEAGADLEATDKTGATALMYAAQFDHDDIVTALIEAGANVNAADSLGWTPLIRAVVGGNIEAVQALMAANADVDATDFFGRNAVQVAQGRDLDEIVAVLQGTAPPPAE